MQEDSFARETKALHKILESIRKFFDSHQRRLDHVDVAAQRKLLEKEALRYADARDNTYFGVFQRHNSEDFVRVSRHGAIQDNEGNNLTVSNLSDEASDWAFEPSPVAPISYKANVEIRNGQLIQIYETGEARQQRLIEVLNQRRDGQLTDIFETIREEQDRLVRSNPHEDLVIQGGPGTGKTAVGLQRLAYVMFEDRGRLGDRSVVVLGPSTAYSRYVTNFLPRLGFRKVVIQTYDEFISEAIRAANPGMEILPAFDSRAAVRDKNSRAIDRVLIESIWPKTAVPEAAVRVRTDNRRAAEIRRFGREIQEIHDGLRDSFERFEISYEDARQRLYSGLVALLRAENENGEPILKRRPDERIRDDIREFIFSYIRETDIALFVDFQEQIDSRPLLDNELLTLVQTFNKEDIQNAVEILVAEVIEKRLSVDSDDPNETRREKQKKIQILSVSAIRQRLEQDDVPHRTLTAPTQRQFGTRNRVDLGEFRPIDMTADQNKGLGRAVWQYVTKVMPNRDFTRIASETWTGRNRVFTELKVKQIAALGNRLKGYASERERNTRTAIHASSVDLALSAICSALIHGSRSRHAHVFMDEAQDLTLLQARALRILTGSAPLTVTGDLNQSTTFGSINSWETLLENLGREAVTPNTLNVNYRVPELIYKYATKYLDDDSSVTSVRCELEGGELEIVETPRKGDSLARASDLVESLSDAGLIGVAGDPADLREMNVADSANILVTSPAEAKGLEVDHLIVVEPSTWYDQTPETRRAMFVVLTRSTKTVTVIQSSRAFGRIIPRD